MLVIICKKDTWITFLYCNTPDEITFKQILKSTNKYAQPKSDSQISFIQNVLANREPTQLALRPAMLEPYNHTVIY